MANVLARKPNLGFSLIEVVLTLAIFGVCVGLLELIITSVRADATVLNRIKARSLVLDQVEVLRHIDFSKMTTIDTPNLIGDLWNTGQWEVQTVGVTKVVSALGDGEQTLLIPGDRWMDATLSGQLYVSSSTPAGYDVGILMRAQDATNRYRLHFTSSGTFVEREQNGIITILSTLNVPLPTNTWQSFSFSVTGSTVTATVNGQTSSVIDTSPFDTNGHIALWSEDGCCVSFDNLSLTSNKGSGSWDFESPLNTIGHLPTDWERLSLFSLPGGAAHVIIENLGGSELKKATITVTWSERSQTRNESLTTYITRYGLQVE